MTRLPMDTYPDCRYLLLAGVRDMQKVLKINSSVVFFLQCILTQFCETCLGLLLTTYLFRWQPLFPYHAGSGCSYKTSLWADHGIATCEGRKSTDLWRSWRWWGMRLSCPPDPGYCQYQSCAESAESRWGSTWQCRRLQARGPSWQL